ncbi:Lrp/AsnC family transcriptional regulator [Hyphococcus sp.]|uniref:Lrp/AsnC family transcriptional regulator n=1 Tax=Hyphococcus sp. TaxID=2038636 RepID=UPI0035C6C3D6
MIDFIDTKILRALCADGRMTFTSLAEHIHLSQTPTLKRVRRIEKYGYITGYTAILDEKKLGGGMNVFVSVTLANQKSSTHDNFRKMVKETPQIMECFLTSGDSDYLLRIAVDNMIEYEKILAEKILCITPIKHARSSLSLRSIKQGALPPHIAI